MTWHSKDTIDFLLSIGAIKKVIPMSPQEFRYKCKIGELSHRDYKLQCSFECSVCGRRTANWGGHFAQAKPYQEHIKIFIKLVNKRRSKNDLLYHANLLE